MEFHPYNGEAPADMVVDDEDDEVAEAVLELKELTAAQGTELQAIAAKLGRAENEVHALKTEMAELRAAITAGAAAKPAEMTEQAAPVEEAVTPPPNKGRLQRAAEKRKAISEPSGPSQPAEVAEVSEQYENYASPFFGHLNKSKVVVDPRASDRSLSKLSSLLVVTNTPPRRANWSPSERGRAER